MFIKITSEIDWDIQGEDAPILSFLLGKQVNNPHYSKKKTESCSVFSGQCLRIIVILLCFSIVSNYIEMSIIGCLMVDFVILYVVWQHTLLLGLTCKT